MKIQDFASDNGTPGLVFYWTAPTRYTRPRKDIIQAAARVSPGFAELLDANLPERSEGAAKTMAANALAKGSITAEQVESYTQEWMELTNTTDIRTTMAWVVDAVRAKAQPLRALYWCPNDPRAKRFLEHVMTCLGVTYQVWEVK